MSGETTPRDQVWAAAIEAGKNGRRLTVDRVYHQMPVDDRPSKETVRRVLRAMSDEGIVSHTAGSPYYSLNYRVRGER